MRRLQYRPMAEVISPQQTVTFTVTSVPKRTAQRKTIERLIKMQPDVQRTLRHVAKRRKRKRRRHRSSR